MATGAAIAAVVVAVVGAYQQKEASDDMAAEQKKANQKKTAIQMSADIEQRRQKAREERVRRAKIQQAAENTGTAGSSSEVGATSTLATDLASGMAFSSGQVAASASISGNLNKAASAEAQGATWGAASQIANSVFGATSSSLFD